jgi:hypothetical protein
LRFSAFRLAHEIIRGTSVLFVSWPPVSQAERLIVSSLHDDRAERAWEECFGDLSADSTHSANEYC